VTCDFCGETAEMKQALLAMLELGTGRQFRIQCARRAVDKRCQRVDANLRCTEALRNESSGPMRKQIGDQVVTA
jgi:hypothetical protein